MSRLRARGATDNASDYGSEDCRFESCRARIKHIFIRNIFSLFQILFIDIHSYANDLKAFQFFKGEYEKFKINNIADMWATGPLGKISFTLRVLAMGGS